MPKTYHGIRTSSGLLRVMRVHVGSPLPLYLNEVNHSPTGFECGYCGSGPSQLAYAILRDYIGPNRALELYYAFRNTVVADLPRDRNWFLLEEDLDAALERLNALPEAHL